MGLVLLIHYVGTITTNHNSLHSSPVATVSTVFAHSVAVVCVNCFILISGYFSIQWKLKSFLSLYYQILFWLLFGFGIAELFRISYSGFWLSVIGNYFGSRWFIPAYLGLYLISPLINEFIHNKPPDETGKFIIAFYIYSTIIGYLLQSKEFNEGMSVISLIGIYLTGAYLRHTKLKIFQLPKLMDITIFIAGAVLLTIVTIGLFAVGINKSPLGYLNPLVIIMSVYLFLFFQKLYIGQVRWINAIAASAFAVFLFHMHPALYCRYQEICRLISCHGFWTPLLLAVYFALVFLFAILIDRVRILTFNTLAKRFLK